MKQFAAIFCCIVSSLIISSNQSKGAEDNNEKNLDSSLTTLSEAELLTDNEVLKSIERSSSLSNNEHPEQKIDGDEQRNDDINPTISIPCKDDQVNTVSCNLPEQSLNEENKTQFFLSIMEFKFSTYVHFSLYVLFLILTLCISYKILTHNPANVFNKEKCKENTNVTTEMKQLKKKIEVEQLEIDKLSQKSNSFKASFNSHKKTVKKMQEDKEAEEKMKRLSEQEMMVLIEECTTIEHKLKEYSEQLKNEQDKIDHINKGKVAIEKKKEDIEKQIKNCENESIETSASISKVEKELKETLKQVENFEKRKMDSKAEENKLLANITEKKKEIEISNKLNEIFLAYDKEFLTLKDANDDDGIAQLMQKVADDFCYSKTENAIKEMQQEIDALKKALELEKEKEKVYQTELRKMKLEEEKLQSSCSKWKSDIERVISDRKMLEKLVEEKEKECAKAKDEEEARMKEDMKKEQESKELEVLKSTYMKDIEDLKNEIKEMGVQHRQKIAAIEKRTHEYWQSCLKNEKEIAQSKADITYYKTKISEMGKKIDEARSADQLSAGSPVLVRPTFQPEPPRFPPMMPPHLPRLPPPFLPPPPHLLFAPRGPNHPFDSSFE